MFFVVPSQCLGVSVVGYFAILRLSAARQARLQILDTKAVVFWAFRGASPLDDLALRCELNQPEISP